MSDDKKAAYNDDAADVIAVLLIGTIVIGAAVFWLSTL